ncbi:MAG: hypothetical protein D6784_05095 [Chloroflexi bacterium]|nr:MAG: hypothetical protein D6784_05095 [Chloroflexota bacterium]
MDKASSSPIFQTAVVNGRRLPADQAQVSVFNKAVFASFGVYETIKVDRGRPFYLVEHLHRLEHSAALIDLPLPADVPAIAGWVRSLLQLDPQVTCRIFIVALGAVEAGERPLLALQAEPLPTYAPHLYQTGAEAVLFEGARALPACKSLNTLVNFLARRTARQAGALEGLLHHSGYLTEGSRSNLFAVRQGQLLTPPADEVLSGITRDIVLQVMRDTAYPVEEARLPVDISLYDELFITSTSMHVMPITRVEGHPVGTGTVGPVTRLVMDRFEAHYRQKIGDGNLEIGD